MVVTLTVGGGALWTPSHVIGTILWVVAAVVAIASLIAWWKRRSSTGESEDKAPPNRNPDLPDRVLAQSDPDADVVVTVVQEIPHQFKFKAFILEICIQTLNNTDRPMQVSGPGLKIVGERCLFNQDDEVRRETFRLQQAHGRGDGKIGPHGTITDWAVGAFTHSPTGGEPGYEIGVEDEFRRMYVAKRLEKKGSEFATW
ncbi:MAG: hypothetical protein WAO09_01030 [Candidatus Dormiibacterota bacterium]